MILLISGSVGVGKTTIAKELSKQLDFKYLNLNELTKKFKIKDIPELQTYDFDFDKFSNYIEKEFENYNNKKINVIAESHFAHFINSNLVKYLFILNKDDLKELKKIYLERGYNKKKIEDNLEVEILNLCYYEALENGYEENKNLFLINNKNKKETLKKILKIIKK